MPVLEVEWRFPLPETCSIPSLVLRGVGRFSPFVVLSGQNDKLIKGEADGAHHMEMVRRILLLMLCLGVLSTLSGCAVDLSPSSNEGYGRGAYYGEPDRGDEERELGKGAGISSVGTQA